MSKHRISLDEYAELSNLMVKTTREFNEESDWRQISTSTWRSMSDCALAGILNILNIKVEGQFDE